MFMWNKFATKSFSVSFYFTEILGCILLFSSIQISHEVLNVKVVRLFHLNFWIYFDFQIFDIVKESISAILIALPKIQPNKYFHAKGRKTSSFVISCNSFSVNNLKIEKTPNRTKSFQG